MQWDALAVYAAVAEAESFTRAAERLGLPKSTVSRQVAALEADLGVRLLHRTTRRVTPTPAGRRLLDHVAPHVAALARVAAGDLEDEATGTLRITTVPDLGVAVLADVVARYAVLHPGVRVEARLTLEVVDLVAEGFDLALRVTSGPLPDSPHLTASRVGTLRMGLFASPRHLARAGTPRDVGELAAHDLVGSSPPLGGVDLPPPRIVGDTNEFIRAVVRAGGGVGVLPTFVAAADVASGELVRVLPAWHVWTGTLWVVTPQGGRVPRRVAAFRELLGEVLRRGIGGEA
jgi:DNA-binding transcriptional LysR family regulator